MTRTLKRPNLLFNIKYISKTNIKNFKSNILISNINNNMFNLKKEHTAINAEITTLRNSLLNLKDNYGYTNFIQIKKQQTLLEKTYNTISSNTSKANNEPTTKALTVVKPGSLLNIAKTTKKAARISLKSLIISLALSFLNFFV